MVNQATHLNVSMMNEQGTCGVHGVEMADENLCFFSSDETEELYSSSTPDTCGDMRTFGEEILENTARKDKRKMKGKIRSLALILAFACGVLGGCGNKDTVLNTQTSDKEIVTEQETDTDEFIQREIELTASEKNGLCSFIKVMAWLGDYNLPEEAADFCLSFVLNSLHEAGENYEKIINNYEGAYKEEYHLCMSEETLKEYLKDSVGYDDVSIIKERGAQNTEYDYFYLDGSKYKLLEPDTGDYGVGNPQITESYAVSENEILISGTVENYVWMDTSTNIFQMVFEKNADSIWGGYTLKEIKTWNTYILPTSDSEYLTQEDLESLSKEYLRLARHEIYARHGCTFEDEQLKRYFEAQSWYSATVTEVPESELNEFEKANIALISMMESDAHLYKYRIVDSESEYGWGKGKIVIITSYIGEGQSVLDVPEMIEGLPVMVIGRYAFEGHDELTRINLPESVIRLQECPFENCSKLQVIEMTGVTQVDTFPPTLRGLESLKKIYVGQSCFFDALDNSAVEFIDILPRKTYHAATGTWTSEVEVERR